MFLHYSLREKHSKSKDKDNRVPGQIHAYVRTYVERRRAPNFLGLMGLLISMAMDAHLETREHK